MPVNVQQGNDRYLQWYDVVHKDGKTYHKYTDGKMVFVPKADDGSATGAQMAIAQQQAAEDAQRQTQIRQQQEEEQRQADARVAAMQAQAEADEQKRLAAMQASQEDDARDQQRALLAQTEADKEKIAAAAATNGDSSQAAPATQSTASDQASATAQSDQAAATESATTSTAAREASSTESVVAAATPATSSADSGTTVTTSSESGAVSSGTTHTVVAGDTMWDIAQANNMQLADLKALNPQIQNASLIFPGQEINLGGADSSFPASSSYDTSVDDVVAKAAQTSQGWVDSDSNSASDSANSITYTASTDPTKINN